MAKEKINPTQEKTGMTMPLITQSLVKISRQTSFSKTAGLFDIVGLLGVPEGIQSGRQVADASARIAAPHGSKEKSSILARNLAYGTGAAGAIGGFLYGIKKKPYAYKKLLELARKHVGSSDEAQLIAQYSSEAFPALTAITGGAAAGGATGLGVGGSARAKHWLSERKKIREKDNI